MRTIVVLNLKGGVAKTTTVVNVAAILAKDYGKKVLVIDGDSQCNTTEFLGGDASKGSLADVLRAEPDDGTAAAWAIQSTRYDRVDLLAADESLMDLDLTKVETQAASATCLRDMAALLRGEGMYDYILIDCPPAFNAASAAALLAADEVIIPIKLDAFSLRGMANLSRQIANMRKINKGLKLGGLLPTMWYKSDNIQEAEEQLRAAGLPVYPHIRQTKKVDDMTFSQQPLVFSSPNSAACVDYRRFVAELVKEGC